MVILRGEPGILKCGGGIKIRMCLVCIKRKLFTIWKQSRNEEDRKIFCEVKKFAKRVAYDVANISCLKDETGAVKVSLDDRKKILSEHMKKLMNVKNEWSDSIHVSKVEGAVRRIEVEEVQCTINQIKIRKAAGSSGFALG